MANKTIHQLTPASTVTGDYELAVYDTDNDSTKKATIDQVLSNITIIGEDSLDTTAQTLIGAINEHQTAISTLNNEKVFNVGTSIPEEADLNNYTTLGNYYSGNVSSCVNTPVSTTNSAMQMWVIPMATLSRVFQLAFIYIPASLPAVYIRAMTGESTWSDWKQL